MSWFRMTVAGIALCASASVAGAQGGTPAGQGPQGAPQGEGVRGPGRGGMQAMLFEGITLTEAQQKKVDEIRAAYQAERRKLMPEGMGGGPPDEATRAKMKAARDRQQAELRAVLTVEQQVIFDKNAAEAKKRSDMRPPPQGGR